MQADPVILVMPQENLGLFALMCGFCVDKPTPFGNKNPRYLLMALDKSKAFSNHGLGYSDILTHINNLREKLPINSEDPLAINLEFSCSDSLSFHSYL